MCLTINKKFHKSCFVLKPKPFIAKSNILVYKLLEYKDGRYKTPYQKAPIWFSGGKWEGWQTMFGMSYCAVSGFNWEVDEGFHSYWTEAAISDIQKAGREIFYAVIPEGSNYYIGTDGDVVSDRLVILNHEYNGKEYSFKNCKKMEL